MRGGDTRIVLTEELFEVSGSSTFSGCLDLPLLQAGPDSLRFDTPLPWDVLVVNAGEGSLLVSGSIDGLARISCARCLDEFELSLHGKVEGLVFLSEPDGSAAEDLDGDEYVVMADDRSIDVADFLKAALVLEVPLVPLHDEGCLGLCPACGRNLNEGPCGCADAPAPDAPAPSSHPFAALRDFKFEN